MRAPPWPTRGCAWARTPASCATGSGRRACLPASARRSTATGSWPPRWRPRCCASCSRRSTLPSWGRPTRPRPWRCCRRPCAVSAPQRTVPGPRSRRRHRTAGARRFRLDAPPQAYVCRGVVCLPPTTDPAAVAGLAEAGARSRTGRLRGLACSRSTRPNGASTVTACVGCSPSLSLTYTCVNVPAAAEDRDELKAGQRPDRDPGPGGRRPGDRWLGRHPRAPARALPGDPFDFQAPPDRRVPLREGMPRAAGAVLERLRLLLAEHRLTFVSETRLPMNGKSPPTATTSSCRPVPPRSGRRSSSPTRRRWARSRCASASGPPRAAAE